MIEQMMKMDKLNFELVQYSCKCCFAVSLAEYLKRLEFWSIEAIEHMVTFVS